MSDYFDQYAQHMIDTEFYAQNLEDWTQKKLDKLRKKIKSIINDYGYITSKSKLNELVKECEEEIDKDVDEYKKELNEERQEQASKERQFLEDLFRTALGVALVNSLLKNKKSLDAPFNSTDTVDTFTDGMKSDIVKAIRTPLLSSYIFGSASSSVSDTVDNNILKLEKGIKSDVHTSVTSLQRNVQRLMIEDKRKIKYQYISMLDDRTCSVCGSYSGQLFDSLDEAPEVPVHNRCRCYYMPVKEKIDEPTYEEWLAEQPDSVLYRVLGKTRYALYKSGIKISRFVSDGQKLTLEELFKNLNKK